jgi:hypothetical protein
MCPPSWQRIGTLVREKCANDRGKAGGHKGRPYDIADSLQNNS